MTDLIPLVRCQAEALRERMSEADKWVLDAAHMLHPLQQVVACGLAWSLHPDEELRQRLDVAEDDLEVLYEVLEPWQRRIVLHARSLRRTVDGAQ